MWSQCDLRRGTNGPELCRGRHTQPQAFPLGAFLPTARILAAFYWQTLRNCWKSVPPARTALNWWLVGTGIDPSSSPRGANSGGTWSTLAFRVLQELWARFPLGKFPEWTLSGISLLNCMSLTPNKLEHISSLLTSWICSSINVRSFVFPSPWEFYFENLRRKGKLKE